MLATTRLLGVGGSGKSTPAVHVYYPSAVAATATVTATATADAVLQKLFDWRPDRLPGEPLKCERVVIIKNLFSPEDFDKEVALLLEYQQDIRQECLKCGDVKKITIFDRHPEGVAQVIFREPAEAQACVQLLNGRWFSQRKVSAEIWDGKTKYKINETDAEIEARLDKWDKFLEREDEKEKKGGGEGGS
ncbi:hypothetical protein M0804_004707 [Polistes exclamans]|nr:hypothetical protein M0804_004707 [Polistes exclamans]